MLQVEHKFEGNKVTLYVPDTTIWKYCGMYKTHQHFLEAAFRDIGVQVIVWRPKKVPGCEEIPGLVYKKTDSDLTTTLEVTATLGVNARMIAKE